uniref:Uncharacterized protein n=1 Tax=Oncorhynchus kisutch TaxID=8019 RepID=A0A8C7KY68_ONCKI
DFQGFVLWALIETGSNHDKAWSLKTYQEGTHQFVAEHPGFLGAQLIISVPRYSTDILFIIISDTICA